MTYAYYPKIILPVKRNLQDTPYDCGPASLKIILETLGIHISEERLMKLCKSTPEKGTSPEAMIDLFKKLKITFEVIEHATIELIEEKIRNLNLCIVDYQAWGDGGSEYRGLNTGHYSVVFGYNKTHLWIADPAKHRTGDYKKWGTRKMRKDFFAEHWMDKEGTETQTYRWMIAVPLVQSKHTEQIKCLH